MSSVWITSLRTLKEQFLRKQVGRDEITHRMFVGDDWNPPGTAIPSPDDGHGCSGGLDHAFIYSRDPKRWWHCRWGKMGSKADKAAFSDFSIVALQAGQACREVSAIQDLLPAGPLWEMGTDDFWIAIVHSLSWRKVAGSPLRAYCSLIGGKSAPRFASGAHLGLRSCLSTDPFTASVHAINLLIDSVAELPVTHERMPPDANDNIFQLRGEIWLIRLGGVEAFMPTSQGMRHIARLVQSQGKAIDATFLHGGTVSRGMKALDSTARVNYQKRLEELALEREAAQENNDAVALENVDSETEGISNALRTASGRGRRSREIGDTVETARAAVGRAIRAAIQAITRQNKHIGDHFRATIKTPSGRTPRYEPDEPVTWLM